MPLSGVVAVFTFPTTIEHERFFELVQAVILGTVAGITTLVGAALLIYRRRTRASVHGHHRQRQADVRRA